MLVTVGSEDISKIRTLDGEEGDLVHSETGEVANRDMVQFVPFRKYKYDYKGFARSLLEEITVNIKDYFVDRKIYPNPRRKKQISNKGGLKKTKILRDEAGDVIATQIKEDQFQNKLLEKCEAIYKRDMIELGFDEFDVDLLVENGL